MLAGGGDYRAVGAVALRSLAELGAHLVVTTDAFKARHAYLLAMSVDHLRAGLPIVAAGPAASATPIHPGAKAYYEGLTMPGAAEAAGEASE
jgi:hypothetical protein